MDNKAPADGKHYADTLCRLSALGWDWRAGCLETWPGRFGRGRLDSLRPKGLAAYLITSRARACVNPFVEKFCEKTVKPIS
jgi:hypothetical protein